jgi:hypothetical protein
MSDNGLRFTALNGLLMILFGMFLAGFPLVWVVVANAYSGLPAPHTSGDYRAWNMAHLEGLLNGMLVLLVALVTRVKPMSAGPERTLIIGLCVGGWGNTVAAFIAPLLGVRGMVFDSHPANNLVTGVFSIALIGSLTAFGVAIRHLRRKV